MDKYDLEINVRERKKKHCPEQCSSASVEDGVLSLAAEAVQDLQLLVSVVCKSDASVSNEVPGCCRGKCPPSLLQMTHVHSRSFKYLCMSACLWINPDFHWSFIYEPCTASTTIAILALVPVYASF